VWGWEEGPGWARATTARLLAVCEEVLAGAEAMAEDRAGRRFLPEQMLVGLPASQLWGRAWTITQQRPQPDRPVEERELQALLGRALRFTINKLRSAARPTEPDGQELLAAADSDGSGWLLVDAATVALTVDGRRVTDPVGFRAREIGATVFAALAQAETVEMWRLVATGLEFTTLTLTAAAQALALGPPEFQGVLLDVGGQTTDLTLWQAGRPVALESLPVGGAALTSSLLSAWGLSVDQAERIKLVYASGRLTDGDKARIREVMFPALRVWLEQTEAALMRLSPDRPLPQRLYLFGGGSALPEIVEGACALAWSEGLRFERYPQVELLSPTDVPGVINRTDLGRRMGDVSALALAAWAARETRPLDRPARILAELCQGQLSR
jgi:cell division protein FtsA